MTDQKIVTGVDYALVRVLKQDGSLLREEIVRNGQPIPADVKPAEVSRLAELGVFKAYTGPADVAAANRAAGLGVLPEGKALTPDGRLVDLPKTATAEVPDSRVAELERQLQEAVTARETAEAAQAAAEKDAASAKEQQAPPAGGRRGQSTPPSQ